MKFKIHFLAALVFSSICGVAQNHFPTTGGNAGVNTTTPAQPFTIANTTNNEGLRIGGSTYYLDILANMTGSAYHPLVNSNTVGLIYKGSSENYAGNLVIAPWGNAVGGGIHMDQYGRVGIGTYGSGNVLKLNGGNNPLSGLGYSDNYQLRISHNYNGTGTVASGIALGGNNSDATPSASIYHVQQGQPSYGDLAFATRSSGGSMTEHVRIGANGYVGIGTANPQSNLHLYGTNPGLFIEGDGNSYYPAFRIKGLGGDGVIDNWGITNITAGINMRAITSNGSIQIGATYNGVVSHTQNPSLVTHNVIGATNQTADIFRVSKYTPDGAGNFASTALFKVAASGNVGINTTNPLSPLDIATTYGNQAIRISQEASHNESSLSYVYPAFSYHAWKDNVLQEATSQISFYDRPGTYGYPNAVRTSDIYFQTAHSWNGLAYGQYLDNTMVIKATQDGGYVGIGTTNPQSKLAVDGTITTRKLKVTQNGWADYVFEDNYKLPTLIEVEEFIKRNKHLPGIVSAKQVEKEGIDVGENQAALLKKIEELTLYVIDIQKQMDIQKKEIAELKKSNRGNRY